MPINIVIDENDAQPLLETLYRRWKQARAAASNRAITYQEYQAARRLLMTAMDQIGQYPASIWNEPEATSN